MSEKNLEYQEYAALYEELKEKQEQNRLQVIENRIAELVRKNSFVYRLAEFITKRGFEKMQEASLFTNFYLLSSLSPAVNPRHILTDFYHYEYGEPFKANMLQVSYGYSWHTYRGQQQRADALYRRINEVVAELCETENLCLFHMLYYMATHKFKKSIITQIPHRDISKRLLVEMHSEAQSREEKLTTLVMSYQDLKKAKDLGILIYDRKEIYEKRSFTDHQKPDTSVYLMQTDTYGDLYFKVIVNNELGMDGKFTIYSHDDATDYHKLNFFSDHDNQYNKYQLATRNRHEGKVTLAGETQIIGLCGDPYDYLKIVSGGNDTYIDPYLFRHSKTGFFGHHYFNLLCSEPDNVLLGVINRTG